MSTVRALRLGMPLLLLCSLASRGVAQESGAEEVELRNAVEVFVGAVTETEESATGFGVGLEYNRRLSRRWSLGVELIEISTTDVGRGWLVIVPAYFHPVGGLSLKAGAGVEGSKEEPEDGSESETKIEFAARFGAAWEFELGRRFTISPEVNLDLVGGSVTWVYGLSFGFRF